MKLVFEERDNLTDKDLIALCNTEFGTVGLVNIIDVFDYYRENEYTTYDIICSLMKYNFDNSRHKININGRELERYIPNTLKTFKTQLDEYIEMSKTNSELLQQLNDVKEYLEVIEMITDDYDLKHAKNQDRLYNFAKYDEENGGKIKEYIDTCMINSHRYRDCSIQQAACLTVLQYIFDVKYEGNDSGLFRPGKINSFSYVPDVLFNIFLKIARKNHDDTKLTSIETALFKILLGRYWCRISRRQLDNLRYIKLEFSSKTLEYLNILCDLNDLIEEELYEQLLFTDYEKEDFQKYKTKLIKYTLDRAM